MRYALVPHAGDWREAGVFRDGLEFNHPLLCRNVLPHAGSLPEALGAAGGLQSQRRRLVTQADPRRRRGAARLRGLRPAGLGGDGQAASQGALRRHEANFWKTPAASSRPRAIPCGSTCIRSRSRRSGYVWEERHESFPIAARFPQGLVGSHAGRVRMPRSGPLTVNRSRWSSGTSSSLPRNKRTPTFWAIRSPVISRCNPASRCGPSASTTPARALAGACSIVATC